MSKLVCEKCGGTLFNPMGGVSYTVSVINGTPPHDAHFRCNNCRNVEVVHHPATFNKSQEIAISKEYGLEVKGMSLDLPISLKDYVDKLVKEAIEIKKEILMNDMDTKVFKFTKGLWSVGNALMLVVAKEEFFDEQAYETTLKKAKALEEKSGLEVLVVPEEK